MGLYEEAVLDFRNRKDQHFAAGNGPVDPKSFHGLRYFAPDESWAFTVLLDRLPQDVAAEFPLETNTGETRVMARYGQVTVPLPGGERTLSVFAPLGDEQPARVFIPFRDATSGAAEGGTYGAGRYLDAALDRQLGGEGALVRVDFNLAYHPYCAYGDGWTCPLPPRENWLPDAVTAGERLP
ncbi:hypothetical protein GCM10008959_11640 [Deinococcus seoulensis]|uniref:DUF1684 domain-containing protein n=2 Tax=Deinococcus TaxID=1298 RepID=A0ABQ2RNC5_9DEIO|nr:hypothetical protein GCM10008959_11640 [Deinococcus seoulensis]GGS34648.1 hypothetical protein GCM10008961_28020 [Deinococcus knuensis]